ncbi:hypothetical protein CWE09_04755 [Aliidiomarina minuta]|uniref:HEAT repeat domain-containing protein n=1 Tax=Aliidiomarina minuta TaxID=880057 RepID=A0A432W7I1_9GAMM|nr:HEAT repeat domain-containing protein [Aliidiomarina minuta]RUO26040.1 hypothetical protein CWE09_04755 [Aliidiomarina minuta]
MKFLPYLIPCFLLLAGCAQFDSDSAGTGATRTTGAGSEISSRRSAESIEEDIKYYISKLPDRDYTDTYGGEEHPKTWYIAAEALGWIGKPAVPHLMQRLNSRDPYEVMLALYALQLATQDGDITWRTNGEYIRLGTVLDEGYNYENRVIAREWWRRHGHIWD